MSVEAICRDAGADHRLALAPPKLSNSFLELLSIATNLFQLTLTLTRDVSADLTGQRSGLIDSPGTYQPVFPP